MRPSRHFLFTISCFLYGSIFLLCFVFIPEVSAGNVVIICNKSVPEISLSKNDLRNIFLGKKRGWKDNIPITIVTLREGEVHNNFCKEYVGKSSFQFGNYWKHMQFTGKGQIPKSFNSEEEMIDFIATTKGAVGYISSEEKTVNVHVLSVN